MKEVNQTVITSVKVITFGLVVSVAIISTYLYLYLSGVGQKQETRDRVTVCIQTVMQESRASGKPVDADKAREICG